MSLRIGQGSSEDDLRTSDQATEIIRPVGARPFAMEHADS